MSYALRRVAVKTVKPLVGAFGTENKHVVAVHCYHNLVIIEKGVNNEGATKARGKARSAALRTGAMTCV